MPKVPIEPLKLSYDLRFAHRPSGGAVYTVELIKALVKNHESLARDVQVVANCRCAAQRQVLDELDGGGPAAGDRANGGADRDRAVDRPISGRILRRYVRSRCLTLRQHWEFSALRWDRDVYHYPHFDAPLGLRGIGLVITIHDLFPLVLEGYCSAAKRAYYRWLVRKNTRRAARIIAVSERTRQDLIEHLGVPATKIEVIAEGCCPRFRPLDDSSLLERVRRRYRLPEHFCLYTGNQKPHKNLPRLLEAFSRLPAAIRREYPLVLTGPAGGQIRDLRQAADRLGIGPTVHFLGLLDRGDLPAVYNLASLYILASLYEGFGLGPLEAMACATPVAVSRTGAIPEVVGSAGRYFDPRSIEQIAETLRTALEQDVNNPVVRQKVLAQAGRFTWRECAQRTYRVYQAACRDR